MQMPPYVSGQPFQNSPNDLQLCGACFRQKAADRQGRPRNPGNRSSTHGFYGRRRTARLVAAALPLGRNRWFHPMERSQLYGSISLNVIVVNQNFAFHSSPRPRIVFV
ncbi:hypothetical protein CEXT_574751 [Caerostris extrusa]|uniref:Uncharacterized protein n=1 Tax=Caerostris extrusa TaxID=172846 RepID=A0AAV4U4J1_CAEEX|nr:hypothetical protein CEXT_574751 [Caerostris extrusa]